MKSRKVRGRRGGVSLFGIAASFHWFVNILLAVIFYYGFVYAEAHVVVTQPLYGLTDILLKNAKYPIALFFLLAVIPSFFRRRKRRRLLRKVRKNGNLDKALTDISWYDFELLVGEIFREKGYKVCEGQATKDGGIDLTLRRRGKVYLVQCKHWKASVGVPVIREIYGVATMMGAHQAIVVCSGRYTKEASAFAKKTNVKLVGIEQLENAISR